MIDTFNLPDDSLTKEVFYANGTTSWQIWTKPSNAKFVNMVLIGGGGGGGAGASSNSGAGGGGGGGCSAISRVFFHASFLPDRLYVQVGNGGLGGSQSPVVVATSGGISYVSIQPNTTTNNVIVASGAAGGGFGGAGGNGGAAGSAGTAGSIYTASLLTSLGSFQGIAGIAGLAGGTGGGATLPSITIGLSPYLLPITPGLGGCGLNASAGLNQDPNIGGRIIGTFSSTISGGTSSPTFAGPGSSGYCGLRPNSNSSSRLTFLSTGGAGGGAGGYGSVTGSGGEGGFGGIGSGGGGGGGCFFGSTNGGRGGRGGDGIVIINCY
jgi:hypothetical protein